MVLATAFGADTGKVAALVAQIAPPVQPRLFAPLNVSLLEPPRRSFIQLQTKRGGVTVQIGSPRQGFTLIELIVALAVLAIVTAAAVPSFVQFFEKARLRGAADEVVSLMVAARGGAVKLDRDVAVAFAGDADAWCVGANAAGNPLPTARVPAAAPCDCEDNAGACLVDGEQLVVDGARFQGVSMAAFPAAYTVDGKLGSLDPLAASTLTLNSTSGRFALQLGLSPLGQSTVCVPAGKPAFGGYGQC